VFEPTRYPTGHDYFDRPPVLTPPLLPDVYKIRSVANNNLVTLLPSAGPKEDGPRLVTDPEKSADNKYQQWIVTYEQVSQKYFIRNKKTGTYITSTYDVTTLQGGVQAQLWDIRQTEYDGYPETQLAIHLPSTRSAFRVESTSDKPNVKVGLGLRAEIPTNKLFRFIFEPANHPTRTAPPLLVSGRSDDDESVSDSQP